MPKEEMNAFDVRALVRELQLLVGGRLDKPFQPSKEEILLRFRARKDALAEAGMEDESAKRDVAIHVGKWMCLTKFPREMPMQPPAFTMTLRKHVAGARVAAVRQHEFDRVVEFQLERKEDEFLLIVELFHNGNVMLVKDGKILQALRHESWATREIRPGAAFVQPPARFNPITAGEDEFRQRLRASNADAVRTLAAELGLGGQYAEELCARVAMPKEKPVSQITDLEIRSLHEALKGLLSVIEWGELDSVVAHQGETKVDVAPIALREHEGLQLEKFPTFNEALDRYFGKAVTVERVDPRLKRVNEERSKIQRMLDAQDAAIGKFEREGVECKEKGDLLYAHFDTVQQITARLMEAAKQFGWDEVKAKLKGARKAGHAAAQPVESVNPNEGLATLLLEGVDGKPHKVQIDLRKSVQDNANAYYDRSKKMREKLEGAKVAREMTLGKLQDVAQRGDEILAEDEARKQRAKSTKRLWFDNYRWFVSSDGAIVVGGRDAQSNEKVVAKHLEKSDRYVHADVHGAPSIVAKAVDGDVPERTLAEAAQFAASMSRAWSNGLASGEAYWVTPEQVSKTPNPGEYLAKGAFIVRGKRNYSRVPIRLAVGEVEIDGVRKVMGGPPAAVQARSTRYVVIEPGDERTNQLANRLAKIFDVPVEEVQAVLPPGPVKVVESKGV